MSTPDGTSPGTPVQPPNCAAPGLAIGEWRRLHPMTPLLRGGFIVLAVLGWIIAQQWNTLVGLLIPDEYEYQDPAWGFVSSPERLVLLLGGTVLLALLVGGGSYLAWRMHTFRVTEEVLEERSGVLSRKHRQARLDRIQSIDITRPVHARIVGAASLDVDVAGNHGNISLKYVRSGEAEQLRAELLRLASGAHARSTGASSAANAAPGTVTSTPAEAGAGAVAPRGESAGEPGGVTNAAKTGLGGTLAELVRSRVAEFTDVDAPTRGVPESSVVSLPAGRLIATAALDLFVGVVITVGLFATAIVVMVIVSLSVGASGGLDTALAIGVPAVFFAGILPFGAIAVVTAAQRLLPNLQYAIVGTPDGMRITRGFLSTTNETLPPGRIHAIEVRQPLLWRPFGWWEIRVNRAGLRTDSDGDQSASQQRRAVILPVGTRDDVTRVLALALPTRSDEVSARIIADGMMGRGGDGYTAGPPRGAVLRPFSWRLTGRVLHDDTLYLRRGLLTRRLSVVPAERMQSVAIAQGLVGRALNLANVTAVTVAGQVPTSLPVVDPEDARALFDALRRSAIRAAALDSSHRWADAAAQTAVASARLRVADARARGAAPSPADLAVLDAEREFTARTAGGASA